MAVEQSSRVIGPLWLVRSLVGPDRHASFFMQKRDDLCPLNDKPSLSCLLRYRTLQFLKLLVVALFWPKDE